MTLHSLVALESLSSCLFTAGDWNIVDEASLQLHGHYYWWKRPVIYWIFNQYLTALLQNSKIHAFSYLGRISKEGSHCTGGDLTKTNRRYFYNFLLWYFVACDRKLIFKNYLVFLRTGYTGTLRLKASMDIAVLVKYERLFLLIRILYCRTVEINYSIGMFRIVLYHRRKTNIPSSK